MQGEKAWLFWVPLQPSATFTCNWILPAIGSAHKIGGVGGDGGMSLPRSQGRKVYMESWCGAHPIFDNEQISAKWNDDDEINDMLV